MARQSLRKILRKRSREIVGGLRSKGGIAKHDIRPVLGWHWAWERRPYGNQRKPKPRWMTNTTLYGETWAEMKARTRAADGHSGCRVSYERRLRATKTR